MQTFNYKPKTDIKTLGKTYWPVFVAVGFAIWFILRPMSIRFFRLIRIPHPIPVIVVCIIAVGVIVYYIRVKMPRLKSDLQHSKPITLESGVMKYTSTKGGVPKEITFNVEDAKVTDVDDDDEEFSITLSDNDITFYANYFDDDNKYQEFKNIFGVVVPVKNEE